jgi:thiol-disulfide isomerase/thioredoxin
MVSRRAALLAAAAASSVFVTPAFSTETKLFTPNDFAEAQKAGKPIFVAIHATWCPTCKAQKPILSELMAEPQFKNLVYCASSDKLRAAARCTSCGSKGATVQHPGWEAMLPAVSNERLRRNA